MCGKSIFILANGMSAPDLITSRQRVSELYMLRRGLKRTEAAAYVGFSPTKFDETVRDGRMPQPRRVDGRKIWDVRDLDDSFERLPYEDEINPWNVVL